MKNLQNNLHTFVVLAYQESPFLENCLKSVLNQTSKSQVLIATTTKNQHITTLAKKYHLTIIEGKHTDIGGDFDFAIHSAPSPLVTVAHQDDIYEKTYASKVLQAYRKHPDSSIIFTDYFEIRNDKRVYTNPLLKTKRVLLIPIRLKPSLKSVPGKRLILKFGDPISCPAVTFITKNCPQTIFKSNYKCDVDWHAWETLSRKKGAFTFVPEKLMGHRISESSTTTDIINQGIRTKEDYDILKRFWPTPIARIIAKFYQKSEKSNSLDSE